MLSQEYVTAPDAERVTEPPSQIVISAPASTVGKALTVTLTASVLTHPLASVPVTVYVAVAVGEKETPSETLLSQEYVVALPEAERVTEPPSQIVISAPASTVGKALTITLTASVLTHPLASVPVTVYVAEAVGEKETPSETLLSQEYVAAPDAERVTEPPSQIVISAPASTVGKALTVTLTANIL